LRSSVVITGGGPGLPVEPENFFPDLRELAITGEPGSRKSRTSMMSMTEKEVDFGRTGPERRGRGRRPTSDGSVPAR